MDFLLNIVIRLFYYLFLVVVLNMLLPTSTFQKYTKLVVGLLFILVLITPVRQIFQKDLDLNNILDPFLKKVSLSEQSNFNKQYIEQKEEIFSQNQAYILEEMAVQLKQEVEEELIEKFQYKIKDIVIKLNDVEDTITLANISVIEIDLVIDEDHKQIEEVKTVNISFPKTKLTGKNGKNVQEIKEWLAKRWEIPEGLLQISVAQ